jgi:hypothetical protein
MEKKKKKRKMGDDEIISFSLLPRLLNTSWATAVRQVESVHAEGI